MHANCPACGPDFLKWLDADPDRRHAWGALPRLDLDPGQVLQPVGQPLGTVWFVEQGLLRSYFVNADGRERNCAFHAEWSWAGMRSPRGVPALATVGIEAIERSRVVVFTEAAWADWLRRHPELHATVNDALLSNLMALSQRESALLMDRAEARYLRLLAEQPALCERLALHHVASYLGITNVALSRVRKRLQSRQRAAVAPAPDESCRE